MTNKEQAPERDPDHIRYALRCAVRVQSLVAVGKEAFFADDDAVDALCWNVYQIADVTGKLSGPVKARHPEVPWRAVAGLRNFYPHAYEGIDPDRMWDDLKRGDIAQLAARLTVILEALEMASPEICDG